MTQIRYIDMGVPGPKGQGADGASAYDTWLAAGNSGTEAEFLATMKGADGADGASAYETWLAAGNAGTEAEFLASLKGERGADSTVPGPRGPAPTHAWNGTTLAFEQSDGTMGQAVDLKGSKGDDGASAAVCTATAETAATVSGLYPNDLIVVPT